MNKRVVIVGAGFGGLSVANGLARPSRSTSRSSTGTTIICSSRCCIRSRPRRCRRPTSRRRSAGFFRGRPNIDVLLDKVTGHRHRGPRGADRRRPPHSVSTSSFSRPARSTPISAMTSGRRSRPVSRRSTTPRTMRRRILLAFEQRREPRQTQPNARRLLNFVIVGGGPTGVEMAGAHRRAGEPRARDAISAHRPAPRAHHSGRGRAAAADAIRSLAFGGREAIARTARRRGASWRRP